MNDGHPKVTSLIICDDVRKEVSNKDIIIGVYSGDIVVQAFPSWTNAALWIELYCEVPGEYEIHFQLKLSNQQPFKFGGKAKIEKPAYSVLAIPGLQLHAEGPTEIIIEYLIGEQWVEIKRKSIVSGPVSLPFGPPPRSLLGQP